jgi:hypothetical protein
MTKPSLQERVRARLRNWCAGLTHQEIGDRLNVDRSTATKLMAENGTGITLAHLEGFSFLLQKSPAEMVLDEGQLIQPVTPLEAAFLSILRDMSELERRSLLTVLQRPTYAVHAKTARLGRAMLSVKEQELVDLFARVKRDGVREGVLRTLRGAAADDEAGVHPHTRE